MREFNERVFKRYFLRFHSFHRKLYRSDARCSFESYEKAFKLLPSLGGFFNILVGRGISMIGEKSNADEERSMAYIHCRVDRLV